MNNLKNFIGMFAGIFTTIAFIPQIILLYKNKSVKDLSLSTFIILFIGESLWLLYGTIESDYYLKLYKSILLFMIILIIFGYFYYHQL